MSCKETGMCTTAVACFLDGCQDASPVSAATPQQTAALQALADQAQELDMGYGQPDSSATSGERCACGTHTKRACDFAGACGQKKPAPQEATPLPEQDEQTLFEAECAKSEYCTDTRRDAMGDYVDAYARKLAMHLWREHYRFIAPQFELLDDTYGVLSQIDNMLTGLVLTTPEAPASEQQTDQAHVLPPFAAPAGQHDSALLDLFRLTLGTLALHDWKEANKIGAQYRAIEAELASRCRAQGGVTNDDSGDSTSATTASASGERAAGYLTGENFKRLALGQVAEILPVESGSDGKTAVYFRAPAPSRKAAPQPTRAQVNDWMCDVGWQNSAIRQADLARVERVVGLALAQQGAAQAAPASEKGEGNA